MKHYYTIRYTSFSVNDSDEKNRDNHGEAETNE